MLKITAKADSGKGGLNHKHCLMKKAVLVCMAYVDLNPIRAKMVDSVQTAQYTSIFERIHDKASDIDNKAQLPFTPKPFYWVLLVVRDKLGTAITFD